MAMSPFVLLPLMAMSCNVPSCTTWDLSKSNANHWDEMTVSTSIGRPGRGAEVPWPSTVLRMARKQ